MMADIETHSPFLPNEGYISSAAKDKQSITSDWMGLEELINGVQVREVKNVCKHKGGVLTELFRQDWELGNENIGQIFQNVLEVNEISGWHVHQKTTDRLFVNWGRMRIILYDARSESTTFKKVNEFCFGVDRPALLIVPPGIWHAVHNVTSSPAALINIVDKAYDYLNPDHWRLPIDTPHIPYQF